MTNESSETSGLHLDFDVSANEAEEVRRLKDILKSPNVPTALINAVAILSDLYNYQNQGYQLQLVRGADRRRFRLPE